MTKFDWRSNAWGIIVIDLPFSVSPVVADVLFVLMFGANSALGVRLVANGFPIVFAVPGIVLATMFITLPFCRPRIDPGDAGTEPGRGRGRADSIRGQTKTLPQHVELRFNDLDAVGAFAAASTLTIFAVIARVVKALLEGRRAI